MSVNTFGTDKSGIWLWTSKNQHLVQFKKRPTPPLIRRCYFGLILKSFYLSRDAFNDILINITTLPISFVLRFKCWQPCVFTLRSLPGLLSPNLGLSLSTTPTLYHGSRPLPATNPSLTVPTVPQLPPRVLSPITRLHSVRDSHPGLGRRSYWGSTRSPWKFLRNGSSYRGLL